MISKSGHGVLVIGVVATVVLADYAAFVRVINRGGASAIWVRMDGVDPVVGGSESYAVLPNEERRFAVPDPRVSEVRLISDSAAPYSVEGFN